MADAVDDVKRQVSKVGDDLRNAYSFKPQREAAGRAIDSAKKTVRDTGERPGEEGDVLGAQPQPVVQ